MINSLIAVAIFVYIIFEIIITLTYFAVYMIDGRMMNWKPIYLPYEWRRHSNLNWFSVVVASIFSFIFAPIVYCCRMLCWLIYVWRK